MAEVERTAIICYGVLIEETAKIPWSGYEDVHSWWKDKHGNELMPVTIVTTNGKIIVSVRKSIVLSDGFKEFTPEWGMINRWDSGILRFFCERYFGFILSLIHI